MDGPVLLRGQQLDDGRLDEGHQGHVAVSGHGDGSEDRLLPQLHRQIDARGAVGPADDRDAGRLLDVEADVQAQSGCDGPHPVGADEGDEDPELGGGAEEEGHGVGEERLEVRQRPYPQENDNGIDLVLSAEVDVAQEAQ